MHEGHRRRIIERLMTEQDVLQDHEILEILLFNALPRVNTNPIAHNLIKAFGGLAGVFSASEEQLLLVNGVGKSTAEYLRCIGLCFAHIQPKETALPLHFNARTYSEYLLEDIGNLTYETLEFFCLDKNSKVFFRKSFTAKNDGFVTVEPTEISRLFVTNRPCAVVVAHNHPNTTCTPSQDDDNFTAQIQVLCSFNRIKLYDHIVIGTDGAFSYFLTGKLDEIKKRCNVSDMINRKSAT